MQSDYNGGHRTQITYLFMRTYILKIELPEVTKFGLREPSVDVLAVNRGMSELELQVPTYSAQNRIFLYSYYCGLFTLGTWKSITPHTSTSGLKPTSVLFLQYIGVCY